MHSVNMYMMCLHALCCRDMHTSEKVIPQNCSTQNVDPMTPKNSSGCEL